MHSKCRTQLSPVTLLRNMATSLIEHERIKTTLPKAKELRRVMDRLVTKGKAGECGYLFVCVCTQFKSVRNLQTLSTSASRLPHTFESKKQWISFLRCWVPAICECWPP